MSLLHKNNYHKLIMYSKSTFISLLAINISMAVLFIQGRPVKPGEDIVTCPTPWTKQLELHECARLNNLPFRCPGPSPPNLWLYCITWQKGLCRCDSAYWNGEIILHYLTGPVETSWVLIREMQEVKSCGLGRVENANYWLASEREADFGDW